MYEANQTQHESLGSLEKLLSSKFYQPLFRMKNLAFRGFPILRKLYTFNRSSRDQWVLDVAKSLPQNSRVLDVGAGTCPYRTLFAHCKYFALDLGKLDNNQLENRKGYGALDLHSEVTSLAVRSESFDVVLCTEVIEHVAEPIKAVAEMGRVLRPGGRLLVSAPLRSGLHQMPFHFYGGFTPSWYTRFLGGANFVNIGIQPVCGLFGAYAEESLYVMLYLSPFSPASNLKKLFLFPFWLLLLPWLGFVFPLLFLMLDDLGLGKEFTVGYRVDAVKNRVPPGLPSEG